MLKKLVIALGVLVVIIAVLFLVAFGAIDGIAKQAVERVGTYVLQVPVKVESADVKLREGSFALTKLDVANPEGFDEPRFLGLGNGKVTLNTESVGTDVLRLTEVALGDIDVDLIRGVDGSNYGPILESLKRFQSEEDGGSGTPSPDDQEAARTQVVIDRVVIEDVEVRIRMAAGLPGIDQLTDLNVPIDRIVLEDVGKDPENPVDVGGVVVIVVQAVIEAVVDKAGNVLPEDFIADLEGGLAALSDLGAAGITMVTEVGAEAEAAIADIANQIDLQGAADAVGGALEGAAQDAGGAVEDAAKKIGEDLERGLGGLLGGGGEGEGGNGG